MEKMSNLDVEPPPVRTQTEPLEGGRLDLGVVHPEGLQTQGRTAWRKEKTRLASVTAGEFVTK